MKQSQANNHIAILGAGSFGTALALYLARRNQVVRLWSVVPEEIIALRTERMNNQFLPGFYFPDTILPTANLAEAIEGLQDILVVVPSIGYRSTLELLKPLIKPSMRIINASKGLDQKSGQLFNIVVEEVLGKTHSLAVISGPSFAKEVAQGLPTAVVIASEDKKFVEDLIARFDSPIFRAYPSHDVVGVEVGGVVKNVMAIATGISDGIQQGANARSALLTYGLAEITRLGMALGARFETFVGLSGMGDLILTCLDDQSRNRRFGLALGQGQNIVQAEQKIGQVVEGKRNTELVLKLAEKHRVDMPICSMVGKILQGKKAKEAYIDLLSKINPDFNHT